MKLYKTLENGMHCYYSRGSVAKANARKAYKRYTRGELEGHSDDSVEVINVPTTKKAMIEWLNYNASVTGYTLDPHY